MKPASASPVATPDHVLLGDADVEEAVREALGERLERHVAEVAGQQQDARVARGELDQRADEGAPHARRLRCLDVGERLAVLVVRHRASSAT